METENQILREAVINLTMDNAKLKHDLKKEKKDSEMYREWWRRDCDKVQELEKDIKKLTHYKDTTVGLWAIDKAPSEIEYLKWVKENAFQLEEPTV